MAYRRWREVADLERPDLWVRRTCANLAVSQFRRRMVELRATAQLAGRRQPHGRASEAARSSGRRSGPSRSARRRRRRCASSTTCRSPRSPRPSAPARAPSSSTSAGRATPGPSASAPRHRRRAVTDLDTLAAPRRSELLERTVPDVAVAVRRAAPHPDPADDGQAGRRRRGGRPGGRRLAAQTRSRPGHRAGAGPGSGLDQGSGPDPGSGLDSGHRQRRTARPPRLRRRRPQSCGHRLPGHELHLPTDAAEAPLMQFSPGGSTLYYSDDRQQLRLVGLASGTKGVLMPCPVRGCLGGTIAPRRGARCGSRLR